MARVLWPLRDGRPCVEVVLTLAPSGHTMPRILLADTGAGLRNGRFQLILDEDDCLLCGGNPLQPIKLSGAYQGLFLTYALAVQVPALGFHAPVRVAAVPSALPKFDGIAGFGFLNRFTYGNFGDPAQFGLEC